MEAFNYDKQTPFSICRVVFASEREMNGVEIYSTSASEVEKEHVNFDASR